MVLSEAEWTKVFFPIDQEKWAQALGQLRRLRSSGRLERISSSDRHWNSVFMAALVETVDSLLLEEPRHALALSAQGILLAERIRPDDCPGGTEVGKRSFRAWAHAVHGSACRASELYEEAEDAFAQATWLATSKVVLPWATAEVHRRHAWLLLHLGSMESLELANRAVQEFGEHRVGRASALLLKATCYQRLLRDSAKAALTIGLALELIEPKNSTREARMWTSAIHNLNYVYALGSGDIATLQTTLRRVRALSKSLSKNEGYRRALCRWTEALLLAPLGSTRGAKRLLIKAQTWLFKNGYLYSGILCTIELALLYLRDDEKSAAAATVDELGKKLAAAKPATAEYLDFWLNTGLPEDLREETLAAFRTAVIPLGNRRPRMFQPSTGTMGATSAAPAS